MSASAVFLTVPCNERSRVFALQQRRGHLCCNHRHLIEWTPDALGLLAQQHKLQCGNRAVEARHRNLSDKALLFGHRGNCGACVAVIGRHDTLNIVVEKRQRLVHVLARDGRIPPWGPVFITQNAFAGVIERLAGQKTGRRQSLQHSDRLATP